MDLEVWDSLQRSYDFDYAGKLAVGTLESSKSANGAGWRKTFMYERSCFSSNDHDYRTMDIRPQIRRDPTGRVQPAILFNLLTRG
jgi:hypothetical protein